VRLLSLRPKHRVVLAVALSIISPMTLRSQNLAIRASGFGADQTIAVATPAGDIQGRVNPLVHSPKLVIVLAKDTLLREDYEETRRFIASVYKSSHAATAIRLATLSHGITVDVAGPFRSAAELQAVLHNTGPDTDPISRPDAAKFIDELAQSLEPAWPEWGFALVVGRVPQFDPSTDPMVTEYSAAWLARRSIAQKRSLIFWDPAGSGSAGWTESVTRNTGGSPCGSAADLNAGLANPGQLLGVRWDQIRLTRGFDLQTVRINGLRAPTIAAQPTTALPDAAQYAELRDRVKEARSMLALPTPDLGRARASLEWALSINPADRDAVKLRIDLAERENDRAVEISQIETAVELAARDAALWTKLGDLQFRENHFEAAEVALLHARELGTSNARSSEELGRIRFSKQDPARAFEYVNESLRLDGGQQALWFFSADVAKQLGRADKQAESLERGLALGTEIFRRIELIRIYLVKHDKADAARNVDLELPRLPSDPDIQATWARFYEELARPDDALGCWKRVIAVDPKREPAHLAISSILLNRQQNPEALQAAERGLEIAPHSGRLELIKAASLERMNRIYELRRSLNQFAAANEDLEVLRRAAETADVYGGPGPQAYRRYAEALSRHGAAGTRIAEALDRGLKVSIRERDTEAVGWFEGQLSRPGKDRERSAAPAANGVWVPGGLEALAFIAHGHPGKTTDRSLIDYCRTVLAHSEIPNSKDSVLYRKAIANYFEQLRQLLALASRTDHRAVLVLSLDKQGHSRTEAVLKILGWRIRRTKQQLTIESGEKASQSQRQELSSALAIDQSGMQSAFQQGKPFRIEIEFEWVPVVLEETVWHAALQTDRYAGGLAEALSQNPEFARVYIGLSNVDRKTGSLLVHDIGLSSLSGKYGELLLLYSSALALNGGRVVTPGGISAEAMWTKLCGASPSDPARFFRSLFDKDSGRMLAFFFSLSQVDVEHQRFFTLSTQRTAAFYQAFAHSAELQIGASRLTRNGSFADFLREIPLDGDHVAFPGSPEVWMVAKGRSATAGRTEKLLRKARRHAAPEVEDEILLRLARMEIKIGNDHVSELENFLAVMRIDEHRDIPLDEESALILAQNYTEFRSFYPYFAIFRSMKGSDFKAFFDLLGKVRAIDEVQADLILGDFHALLELTRLAMDFSGVPEMRGTEILRSLCVRFSAAADLAGFALASLDTVRDLIRSKTEMPLDPDLALSSLVLGETPPPLEVEWRGAVLSTDAGRNRSDAYGRVLDLQKTPRLALLLRIDDAIRRIAAGNESYGPLIDALRRDVSALPTIEIPKTLKFGGHAKQSITLATPGKMSQTASELQQRASKKKVNQDVVRKLCHELLVDLGPQIRIALTGLIYAVYLSPDDILVANDPMLVRKHQSFELRSTNDRKNRFPRSSLIAATAGEGSFFIGGFAQFAVVAVRASRAHQDNVNADLYVNQMASLRMTPWLMYLDNDQHLLGLRIRIAREWCVQGADDAGLLKDLEEETLGVLPLTRRRALLNAIATREWRSVWGNLTLSDLLFLGERYMSRYSKSPWNSPVDGALRKASLLSDGSNLRFMGPLPVSLYGCDHPHLVRLAPYEEYERHMFPTEIAERAAELKIYLSNLLDRIGLPAAAMSVVAESVAERAFNSMKMSDERDWASALRAFENIDEEAIGAALEARK
jgi:tetratricopeptide (TPR) repeat protein